MPRENPPSASNSSGAVSSGSHFWQMAEVCKRGECELAPALRLIYEWQIRWPSSIFGEIATQTRGLATGGCRNGGTNPALDRFGAVKTKFVYVATRWKTQKICQSMNQNWTRGAPKWSTMGSTQVSFLTSCVPSPRGKGAAVPSRSAWSRTPSGTRTAAASTPPKTRTPWGGAGGRKRVAAAAAAGVAAASPRTRPASSATRTTSTRPRRIRRRTGAGAGRGLPSRQTEGGDGAGVERGGGKGGTPKGNFRREIVSGFCYFS